MFRIIYVSRLPEIQASRIYHPVVVLSRVVQSSYSSRPTSGAMPPRRGTKRKPPPTAVAADNNQNGRDVEKRPKLEEDQEEEKREPEADNNDGNSNNNADNNNNHHGEHDNVDPLRRPHHFSHIAEQHSIILRKYYPPEMSNDRAQAYIDGVLPTPFTQLTSLLNDEAQARQKHNITASPPPPPPPPFIIHWFRTDLRLHDNRALSLASQTARDLGIPLICIYLLSPEDFEAHSTSPIRVDFILRSLRVLRRDLMRNYKIPLYVETVARRRDIPSRVISLAGAGGKIFANMEYEVDELRRDAEVVRLAAKTMNNKEEGGEGRGQVEVRILHDTCVVPPGSMTSGSGKPYAVYTPWYKSWMARLENDPGLLVEVEGLGVGNEDLGKDVVERVMRERFPAWSNKGLFSSLDNADGKEEDMDGDGDSDIVAPEGQALEDHFDAGAVKRLRALWPAGEHEARRRLGRFCGHDDEKGKRKRGRIEEYAERRNFPAAGGEEGDSGATSALSVHLAAGTLSAREAVRVARKGRGRNEGEGVRTWISEVAWRDFYRHVMVAWPFVCMSKPFKPIYANISWSYSESDFEAWTSGRTGYPIVDAAMRQMAATGWMHNRPRMIAASFLAKDLLQDWRKGEQFFMRSLVDGDLASNNGGWGFAASVGVDPQPYFRIFNPTLQGEKFDPDGHYVRKWVPELRGVAAPAIHDPYARGAGKVARKNGYPEKIVDHKVARERALKAYKGVLGKT